MILIALEYLILASTFTVAKKVLSYCPYLFLLTTRFLVGSFFLVGVSWFTGTISWSRVKKDRWLFLCAGVLHSYLAFVLEFWALQYMTSAKASLIYAMTPFWAALLSYILYKEVLSVTAWFGILVATLGLLPLFISGDNAAVLFTFSLADAALCIAVFSAAAAWFVVKKLMSNGHHLLLVNGVAMGIGAMLCGATMLCVSPGEWQQVTDWPSFVLWMGILIFLSHIISYNLYSWLLTRYSITFMTLCGALCPLFSAGLGAFFLNEVITWHFAISLFAVVVGLFLFTCLDIKKSR